MTERVPKDRKLYGNYQVKSPDNILMFRCDEKKAKWYLNRNLAELIGEEIIKLNFLPKGLGNHERGWGLAELDNKCVNCGTDEFLTRHHVVPYCYRRYFPNNLKTHNCHDVLSMCIKCHDKYELSANKLKNELSIKFNAPINGIVIKHKLSKIIKFSKSILEVNENIPPNRVEEMKLSIKNHLGRDFIDQDLVDLSNLNDTTVVKRHGEIVMSEITDIHEFIVMWRKHFIENNECKYMPEKWNTQNIIETNE